MDLNHMKEQFSIAYVKAVASAAGCITQGITVDLDGVDMLISSLKRSGKVGSPWLSIQLKCTASDLLRDGVIKYPLRRKNYDDLIATNYHMPRILVVVRVPEKPSDWLDQSEEALAMRHCAYWVSLAGHPPTENEGSVTIEIPRDQMFSVQGLTRIMTQIGEATFQ